jgi:uncharacterized membrane-anchored protein
MARLARLGVVVAVQLAILAAVPARTIRARLGGTGITLRTAPVDPFDVLSGHYVTLSYEVERESRDHAQPGLREGEEVWLTVAYGEPAWTLVGVTREKPAPASGRVSIRARQGRGGFTSIEQAERLYVTEERGAAVDARRGRQVDLVDLRVGDDGTPAVLRLRGSGIDIPAR